MVPLGSRENELTTELEYKLHERDVPGSRLIALTLDSPRQDYTEISVRIYSYQNSTRTLVLQL